MLTDLCHSLDLLLKVFDRHNRLAIGTQIVFSAKIINHIDHFFIPVSDLAGAVLEDFTNFLFASIESDATA